MDVNDVSYALEKVIEQRKAEDTWQIDTFGSVSAAPIRPPDEVLSLPCRGRSCTDTLLFAHRPLYCVSISVSL